MAFEAPAAEVLLTAHRELEKLVMTPRQQRIKELVSSPYGDWVHEGQLLDPVCRDIEALFVTSQQRVTGVVNVLFRPGSVFVEGVNVSIARKRHKRQRPQPAAGYDDEAASGLSPLAVPAHVTSRRGDD